MPDSDAYAAGLAVWSQDVRAALRRLDPVQRRVLRLIYFERRTQEQVAAELQLSRRTVSQAVAAGMQALTVAMLGAAAE